MNWIISNRIALSRNEFENLTNRVMIFPKRVSLAIEKRRIGDYLIELIKIEKELNAIVDEVRNKYQAKCSLESDIEQCFVEFKGILYNYH
ncbi:hypothetical protein [Oceanobacillus picturae]|uniref:hypothetical protein n=1 Tax=Oceanobacillus picturae TaxID=171693 RepID=UPI0036300A8B